MGVPLHSFFAANLKLIELISPRWLEPEILASTRRLVFFYAIFILMAAAFWLYHKLIFYPKQSLIYEDIPEPSAVELFHAT